MRFGFVVFAAAVVAVPAGSAARGAEPKEIVMEPFVVPTLEAPGPLVDLRPVFAGPRGKDLPAVRTDADGHFTAAGRRVRFWAVNVCFAACFPPHDVADRVAARLAAFGVNCVRFHHMDARAFPRGIWKKDFSGLDPEALDRLDYFLAALKREGVYANINLHVSRDFSRTGSSAPRDELPKFGKKVCIFDPELIALQKQYARDLLTRTNRYTGLKLAADPVVAMVEITNENSAVLVLSRWQARPLAPRFENLLTRLWNQWLARRYQADDALRKAWAAGALPRGADMLSPVTDLAAQPGADEAPRRAWRAEQLRTAAMRAVAEKSAVRLAVDKVTDTSWHLQFRHAGLALAKDRFYTLRFRARAEKTRPVGVGLQQTRSPWRQLGLSKTVELSDQWRRFEVGFTAPADEADAKCTFSVGHTTDDVWLADVSLTPGGKVGLRDGESLAEKNVRRLLDDDVVTDPRRTDFMRFLAEVDLGYFTAMRAFLRDEIGVRAPVTGTEGFTLLSDWVQSHMDFVDSHAYWEHPHFPRRPWDPRDWTIPNKAMVDAPQKSTLISLTFQRVATPDGKPPLRPFTVTEYNHPAPNDAQAECVPMLASFAATQDWDGVFLFAYSHSDDWDAKAPRSFFDIHANPVKMVQMAAGALMFRRGDVYTPEGKPAVTSMSFDQLVRLAATRGPWTSSLINAPEVNSPPHLRFYAPHSIRFDAAAPADAAPLAPGAIQTQLWDTGAPPMTLLAPSQPDEHTWQSAGRALRWSADGEHTGIYTAAGERSVALVGFARGKPQKLGAAEIALTSPDFAAVTLSSLDGKPLEQSRRILITACARIENTGQTWNADRTSVADRWGKAPTLIEPVRATISLKRAGAVGGTAKLLALGGDGKPVKDLPVETAGDGSLQITLGGDPPTLWYILEIPDA